MRHLLYLCLFSLFSLFACTSRATVERETPPPNIIFLLTDDQRQDMMGFAGNPVIQTPNMDRLAASGVYFDNSYVTTAICSVSRASILSGQYARRHNLWWFGRKFSAEAFAETYPMLLKSAGYQIGFIGKYGVDSPSPSEAFDYWGGFGGQGTYHHRDSLGNYLHLTRKIGGQMAEFLDQVAESDAPFNLSVSFKAPHVQGGQPTPELLFPADSAYLNHYEDTEWVKPVQAELEDYYDAEFREGNAAVKRWKTRFSTPQRYDKSLEGYYRLVHGVDIVIGDLLSELEARNLADNTVIIFTSDNGFYLGEYALAGKWFGHEASVRVPMFIYDPRTTARHGDRVASLALNVDMAPTMLELAGVPVPERMQGKSLVPFLRGDAPGNWRKDFLYEHLMPGPDEVPYYIPSTEGVISQKEKYMEYFLGWENDNSITKELYDMATDRSEMVNLISNQPERAARLRERTKTLIKTLE